jgi:hypothetical protein
LSASTALQMHTIALASKSSEIFEHGQIVLDAGHAIKQ